MQRSIKIVNCANRTTSGSRETQIQTLGGLSPCDQAPSVSDEIPACGPKNTAVYVLTVILNILGGNVTVT